MTFVLIAIIGAAIGFSWSTSVSCPPDLTQANCVRFLNIQPVSAGVMGLLALLPVLVGLLFGVESLGREIESRTTVFAWSIATSRARWLVDRTLTGLCATLLVALLCAAANTIVVAKLNPGHDIFASFVGYGLWGPLVIVRAVVAYSIGLLTGLLIGRVLASFTLALVLTAVLIPAALFIGRALEPTVILRVGDTRMADALGIDGGAVAPTGAFVSASECWNFAPADLTSEQQDRWVIDNCPFASKVIVGSQMPIVELRESGVLALLATVSGTAAFARVGNRRP